MLVASIHLSKGLPGFCVNYYYPKTPCSSPGIPDPYPDCRVRRKLPQPLCLLSLLLQVWSREFLRGKDSVKHNNCLAFRNPSWNFCLGMFGATAWVDQGHMEEGRVVWVVSHLYHPNWHQCGTDQDILPCPFLFQVTMEERDDPSSGWEICLDHIPGVLVSWTLP